MTHVLVSVAWLGLALCMLTLALMGATTDGAAADEVAYRAMRTFGDWLLVPISLLAPATGLVLSLGTHWGLARHRWVYTKFWITLALATLSLLAFRSDLHHAAALVADGQPVPGEQLLYGPSVSLACFVLIITISLVKPWGLTRRGHRWREERRTTRTAGKRVASLAGDPAT
ncbi:DUF2269 domain-containing protein [Streptomyces sp. N2-109]|uniref:DUF2269 domain-containing protein n=1 Tax=Streptomyces gossypii TaxID=2883101 RepID=A0ABT2JNI0_9ACTN|nr:DUF2269 domain-containing protein [Streptomyces gossypii]MCT2589278.1 DUF2269 domain-containing protein [Streptomyces gossypii]